MKRWIALCLIFVFATYPNVFAAKQHGDGDDDRDYKYEKKEKFKDKDKDKDKEKKFKKDKDERVVFVDQDRAVIREWYVKRKHDGKIPKGLAKKDRLPPGLERQLVVRGELTPELRERIQPCPEELEQRLPPPPPDYAHVVIGGHIVLLNRRTSVVMDIFNLEL